jgi:hypothetical protein
MSVYYQQNSTRPGPISSLSRVPHPQGLEGASFDFFFFRRARLQRGKLGDRRNVSQSWNQPNCQNNQERPVCPRIVQLRI